jgi:putative ABC transport system substrate-binding protein
MALWRASPSRKVTSRGTLSLLGPKRLQLVRQIVPTVSRVAALQHPGVYSARTMQDMLNDSKAGALGVELLVFQAKSPDQFDGAFAAMHDAHVGAALILPSPMFYAQYRRLFEAATRQRRQRFITFEKPWRSVV